MKKYSKEIIVLVAQILTFYVLPFVITSFMKSLGPMGMVFSLIMITFILSLVIANVSQSKLKYFYPIIVALLFIPTVYIYYNESALIQAVWYLAVSTIGLVLGIIINKVSNKK